MIAGTALAVYLCATQPTTLAQSARGREHWVGTWATAVVARVPPGQGQAAQGAAQRGQAAQPPAAAGQTAPAAPGRGGQGNAPAPLNFKDQTIRQIVHTSIGGSKLRLVLSNAFGTAPLEIGGAVVALRQKGPAIVPDSKRMLMFAGSWVTTIPAGAVVFSDPVNLTIPAAADLAIDLYLPGDTAASPSPLTIHNTALTTNYVSPTGNHLGAASMPVAATTQNWFLLSRVEVMAPANVGAVVAFGDSITDGTRSTPDTNNRWPDHFASRLLAQKGGGKLGVLNLGISGNRVLRDGAGVSALARYDRDVAVQTGVKYIVFLEGINDVGLARQDPQPTSAELIAGHRQIIERAHERGLKIFGATLTPFEGVTIANYFSDQGEATRQAVNEWIRTSKAYDAVIDFDALMRDPASPGKMRPEYDSGDHLHPNDAGYKAMANSVNVALFDAGKTLARPATR
jgi:lysophospholipase L1-like esterase